VEIAEEDYWAAQVALQADPPKLSIASFHTQQMAEKYLKAFLELQAIEVPRTHSLVRLLDLCNQVDADFGPLTAAAASLDEVGIEPRYPPTRLTQEKAQRGLQYAESVRRLVRDRLPLDS